MKYEVKLKAMAEVKQYVEVEAKSAAEALEMVKKQIETDEIGLESQNGRMDFEAWDITYVEDGLGSPYVKPLRVTDVSRADLGDLNDPDWMQDEDGL